jgi:hypothetical protein
MICGHLYRLRLAAFKLLFQPDESSSECLRIAVSASYSKQKPRMTAGFGQIPPVKAPTIRMARSAKEPGVHSDRARSLLLRD